ncbi:lysine-rich arabinogalactan protein 19-like [Haplochromis burtoni]|uniref:lysine-rich arabinogalactan protein 19-like n=1 Tax=Haplochromis burtoni TaxID=8153 RepID=UPI001C2D9A0D|nr:lysine-rich arabinogalactan protein 19-like [Haplochromis burtoni]
MTLSPVLLNNLFLFILYKILKFAHLSTVCVEVFPVHTLSVRALPSWSLPVGTSPQQPPSDPTVSSPVSSPCSATASPIGRPPSYHNGHHRLPPAPHKSPFHSPAQSSPQPPKYPESGGGTIRPVRAAPPPPKQHPRGQVKRREEVEITLV